MVCFADINVLQGSVATYATCGGIFNTRLTTNLPKNLPVVKISQNHGHEFVAHILAHPVDYWHNMPRYSRQIGTPASIGILSMAV